MTLTATASQGFEPLRKTTEYEVMYIPGNPGVTYTRGDSVSWTIGEGIIDAAAANEGNLVGTVLETTICPAATQAFARPSIFDPVGKSAADLCLIPIRPHVAAGAPILLVTFANFLNNEIVVSYTASTRAVEGTTGSGADNRPGGAIAYVYQGAGIGEVNVVESYDHTGGAAELLYIFHRPFTATLDTTSKLIILAGEAAASRGVGFFSRCEGNGATNVTVDQGADDGDYVIFADWRKLSGHLNDLKIPVIANRYLMLA